MRRRLLTAAGIIAAATLTSKLLGFLRETALAAHFGAGAETDAYLAASSLPSILFSTMVGAVGTTFIPVYTQRARLDRTQALRMTNSLLNLSVVLSLGLTLAGYLFAPELIHLLVPGFQGAVLLLTVKLTRVMLPLMLASAVSALATGFLQANERFTAPALIWPVYNLVIITAILFLAPATGILGVAAGTVVAGASQVLVQFLPARRLGYRFQPVIDLRDEGLHRLGRLTVPVLLGGMAGQIGVMVDRLLASRLAEGSISALNYANKLYNLPNGIFVTAVVTVLYPAFSGHAAQGDAKALVRSFRRGFNLITLAVLPMMTGLIVLSQPVVRLVYQRGAFNAQATRLTSFALVFYSLGMLSTATQALLARVFFALQDTTTPMFIGMASVGLNILLNLVLVGPLAHGGLALSLSVAATFNAGATLVALRKKLGPLGGRSLGATLIKSAVATGVMSLVVVAAYAAIARWLPGTGTGREVLRLGAVTGLGAVAYIGALWPLRVAELGEVARLGGKAAAAVRNRLHQLAWR